MKLVIPKTCFQPSEAEKDFLLTQENISQGLPVCKIVENISGLELGEETSFSKDSKNGLSIGPTSIFYVKQAGSDKHRCPDILESFIQGASDHQYKVSPYARDKTCLAMVREAVLGEEELLADDVHAHAYMALSKVRVPFLSYLAYAQFKNFGLASKFNTFSISLNCSVQEYIYSSIEPSFCMFDQSNVPFVESKFGLSPASDVASHDVLGSFSRASQGDFIFLNSSPHRAPLLEEINPKNLGKSRLFLSIMYLSNKKIERSLHL